MKLREILTELNIENNRKCISKGRNSGSVHLTTNDYLPIIQNWNKIYSMLNRKSIKKLEDYVCVENFIKDCSKILKTSLKQKNSPYGSFKYNNLNYEVYQEIKDKIFEKMLSEENVLKMKSPYIDLIEINTWERERYHFYIKITIDNREGIINLYKYLNKLYLNDKIKNFRIGNKLTEEADIEVNTHSSSYLSSPSIVSNFINNNLLKRLVKLDKEKLSNKLYKGGIKSL